MRVITSGAGMPDVRPRQAAACLLVEPGNGNMFVFDNGLGAAEHVAAMQISQDYLEKVFIGHLHADHFCDPDALWIGGVISNWQVPWRIFGPSDDGEKPGTNYLSDRMNDMNSWNWASGRCKVDITGLESASAGSGRPFALPHTGFPQKT